MCAFLGHIASIFLIIKDLYCDHGSWVCDQHNGKFSTFSLVLYFTSNFYIVPPFKAQRKTSRDEFRYTMSKLQSSCLATRNNDAPREDVHHRKTSSQSRFPQLDDVSTFFWNCFLQLNYPAQILLNRCGSVSENKILFQRSRFWLSWQSTYGVHCKHS